MYLNFCKRNNVRHFGYLLMATDCSLVTTMNPVADIPRTEGIVGVHYFQYVPLSIWYQLTNKYITQELIRIFRFFSKTDEQASRL